MKNIFITLFLAILLFISGAWTFQYVSKLISGNHYVIGIVKYHKANYPVSADAPEGYYIESSAIGRVYLEGDSISEYLHMSINAHGKLKEICGNDRGSCFPLIGVQGDIISY